MNDRARFIGTYELVTIEMKDPASGKWSPTPNFNSNGYIIYADTGHMGVHIQPKVRPRFAANVPTGEEAQAALRGHFRDAAHVVRRAEAQHDRVLREHGCVQLLHRESQDLRIRPPPRESR